MATVRDAIKARLSRLKDDVLNSTFIKGNVPSREQQLQRVTPQFQKSVQPIARQANIYKSAIGSGLNDIGSGIRNLPQTFSMLKNNPQQFSKGVDLAIDNSLSGKKAGRYALKGAEGFTEGMSLGTYDLPISASRNNYERSAYVGGNIAGLVNPFNPVNKLAPVFKPASRPLQQPLGHLAGRMIAQGGGKKLLGQGVANLAQGIPYTTAYAVAKTGLGGKYTGGDFATDTGTDLALGSVPMVGGLLIGAKGALKSNGKPVGTMAGDFASTVDKKLRRQISDSLSKVNDKEWTNIRDNLIKTKTGASFLGDLFKHDRLYKAYPEFRKLTVKLDPEYVASGTYGSFNPNDYSIRVNPNLSNGQAKSTLLHEIQHALQTVEGFSKGSNPVQFEKQLLAQKRNLFNEVEEFNRQLLEANANGDKARYGLLLDKRQQVVDQILKLDGRDMMGIKERANREYLRTGGEFEARAVEGRQNIPQRKITGTDPYVKQLGDEGLSPRDITNNGGGVNQSTDPLIAEARKYKSAEEFVKAQQLKKISMENPMLDSYHTGIRNISDIKMFKETLNDPESFVNPDFTREMAENALKSGEITIYSSKPLNNAVSQFATPSKMMASDYAGNGKVYSRKVDVNDIAWISGDEGNFVGKSQLTDIWNQANAPMMSKGVDNGVVKPQGKLVPNRKIDTYVESYANGEKQIKRLEDLQDKIDAMESPKEFKKIQDEINKVEEGNRYAIRELEKLTKLDSYTLLDGISTYIDAGARRGSPTLKDFYNYARVDESFIDSTPIQPQIDRTKLTGMQLETPNAKLGTSPATLKAYGRSELPKTPQVGVEKGRLSQPQVNPVSGQNPNYPNSLDNVIGQSGVRQRIGSQVPMQEAVRPPLSARPKSNTNLQGIESQPVSGSIPTSRLGQSSNGIISPEIAKDIEQVQRAVDKKVNLLDWVRTPDRVLEKIGLKRESDLIKKQYNSYLDQLPKEIDKITSWHTRVKANKGAEGRIFRYLDGQDGTLQGEELKVAQEMQTYLRTWADKLGLPEDKRIASYITHIFEKDFIQKEFDPDLAKLIQDKVPSSVYDPFLQERLGKQGYIEDAFQALDAYVKRATRKYNMDIALDDLNEASQKLDVESWNYVKSYADKINMRPAMIDGYLDNLIKQSPVGYKLGQRPVANISRKLRRWTYRGTLGLNFGSAVRNLTQGVNTYAQLGERWTTVGYMKALKSMATRSDELQRVGVLRDQYIQDRSLSSTKKLAERLDKRLFTFFELAEKINRGGAYFGAKSRALSKGLSEKEAIEQGLEMARKTQFTFGSVDTPVALQGDLVKVLTQFQSFNVKQTEFLTDMAKAKDVAGLVRWVGANALLLYTVGQAMGWEAEDFIPFADALSGERPLGQTPVIKLGQDIAKKSLGANDKYGQPIGWDTIGGDLIPFVPAGSQIKKTYQGMKAQNQGYSGSKTGLVRYPIADTTGNKIRTTLFGQYNTPEAREYFDKERTPLSKNQTEVFKQKGMDYYNKVIEGRDVKRELEKQKEDIKKELTGETGFKLPNPFKAKEAEASSKFVDDTFYYISGDSVKELDLSKYSTKPTNKIDEIRLNEDRFSDAIKVFRNEDIEDADKETLYGKLGVKKNDLAYYDLATDSTEVRREVVNMVGEREYKDRSEYIRSLASLRLELTSGKRVLTDNIIDDLYNEGLLSKNERNLLKNTKWEKGKSPANKAKAKKGKKAPKVKVRQVTAPSFGQINPIKLSGMVQAQPQQPRVNLDGLKLRVKRPQLKLSQSVRAGL